MARVTRHMYSSQFRAQMTQLSEALSCCICGCAFELLCDELRCLADDDVTHEMLKHKSWDGAIYVTRGKKRDWVDPGNAVYAVSMVLLRSMCSWIISRGRRQVPPYEESHVHRASTFKDLLAVLQAKWPRTEPGRWMELMGDICESALARGYNDPDQFPLTRVLSAVIGRVHAILQFIRDHGPYDFGLYNIQGEAPAVRANATKYGVALFYAVRVHHHRIDRDHPRWQEYSKLADELNLVYAHGHSRWT